MDFSTVLMATAVVVILALWFALHAYNRLVRLRNNIRNAWSDVDVQLTLRHDLVPNLVESVKGYMNHERETLEAVAQARSAAMGAGADVAARAAAELALGSAIGNLFVTAERYPDLKASQNFLLLQEQLTTTENRIAFARQHYNETVRKFNTLIAEFPWNLMAGKFGYAPEKMFAAEPQDRVKVQVAS
ncbi:MAG: LemA family protein [Chlamydiota bacterium]